MVYDKGNHRHHPFNIGKESLTNRKPMLNTPHTIHGASAMWTNDGHRPDRMVMNNRYGSFRQVSGTVQSRSIALQIGRYSCALAFSPAEVRCMILPKPDHSLSQTPSPSRSPDATGSKEA